MSGQQSRILQTILRYIEWLLILNLLISLTSKHATLSIVMNHEIVTIHPMSQALIELLYFDSRHRKNSLKP